MKPRTNAAIHYIAEIVGQFDLVGIVELSADVTDLARVLEILGADWKVLFSDWVPDRLGNRERMAILYDRRAVDFTGLAAEADEPRTRQGDGRYVADRTWARSPMLSQPE